MEYQQEQFPLHMRIIAVLTTLFVLVPFYFIPLAVYVVVYKTWKMGVWLVRGN